jgi:hypothetical protein
MGKGGNCPVFITRQIEFKPMGLPSNPLFSKDADFSA